MLYVPNDLYNSAYYYSYSTDYILIYTNQNCYNQNNNRYCNCVRLFPFLNYTRSQTYSCNTNNIATSTNLINFNNISSNWTDRIDSHNIFLVSGIIFALIVFFVFLPISRLFGRWLKL